MAYNFKNALVNLNEEIRKGGGGGGQIAADVAALKASVLEIRSSVAGINQDIDTIKATLESLSEVGSVESVAGMWGNKPLYKRLISGSATIANKGSATIDPGTGITLTKADGCVKYNNYTVSVGCEGFQVYQYADGIALYNATGDSVTAQYEIEIFYTKEES